jgi:hypothetical protein
MEKLEMLRPNRTFLFTTLALLSIGVSSAELPKCGEVGKQIASELDPEARGQAIIEYSIEDTTPANVTNKRTCQMLFNLTSSGLKQAGQVNPMFKMVSPPSKPLEFRIFTNEANGEINYKYDSEQFYDVKTLYLVPNFLK